MHGSHVRRPGASRFLLSAACVLAFSLAAGDAQAQELGRCVSVLVPSPVVLPDGSLHPAGSLEICLDRFYTPVSVLHETRVNGRSIGLFLSRRVANELRGPDAKPFLLFYRARSGNLVLHGCALPDGDEVRTFLMARSHATPVVSGLVPLVAGPGSAVRHAGR